jgi:Cys-tRNA(Pro)/Cys-tRNA(Cys) deacylase
MAANNVTRLLDAQGAQYKVFDLPVEKLGAAETAALLGIPVRLVYKTIVLLNERTKKYLLAIVPGDKEVDLKKAAAFLGEKKINLTTMAEAEKATGLKAGGISALALLNRGFKVILDASALDLEEFHISGGQWGLNIRINVSDFIRVTRAVTAVISQG